MLGLVCLVERWPVGSREGSERSAVYNEADYLAFNHEYSYSVYRQFMGFHVCHPEDLGKPDAAEGHEIK